MATNELSGVFELALSNDYMFTGAQTDDFIVRTTSNVQRILMGTQPGVAPLVTLSNDAVVVAGSLTAATYCNLLLDTVASTSTSNAPTAAALKQTYDAIVTLSNSVGSSAAVTFSSNTAVAASNAVVALSNFLGDAAAITFSSNAAVYGSNLASTASNMVVALSNAVSSQAAVVFASNVAAAALPAAGGVISGALGVGGGTAPTGAIKLRVDGNIVSTGTITACNLQITGTLLTVDTTTSNASQMNITNMGNGPALIVTQTGAEPIADFYDDSNLALRIADGGFVGIGISNPQYTFDVDGDVNFTGTLYQNAQPFVTSRWSSNDTGSNIYKVDGRVAIGSNTHPELFSVHGGNAYFGSNITVNNALVVTGDATFSNSLSAGTLTAGALTANNSNVAIASNLSVAGTFSSQRLLSSGFYVRRDSNVATTTQLSTAVQNIAFNSNNLQFTIPGACNAFQFMATSNLDPVLTIGANGTSTLYGDFNVTGNLRRDGVILWGSNAQSNSVNTFQVLPVTAQFIVGGGTSNVFDLLGAGTYTATPQTSTVYLNGTKLVYVNSNLKDYDLAVSNPNGYTTNYRVTLTSTPANNAIVDITIWPQTPDPTTLTGIYCSNVDFTSNLTAGSLSISSNMTVGGNLVMRNGFFITMDPSQGVQAATVVSAVAPNISSTAQGTTFYIPTQDSNSRFAVTASNNNSNTFIVRGDGKVAIQTPTLTNALTLGGNMSVGASYAGSAAPNNGLIVQGNLGVGLSNPAYPLHVLGDARIQGNLTVNGTTTVIDTNVSTTERLDITNDGTGPTLRVTQLGAQPIADFYDDSNLAVRIADGGAVGIGTPAPSATLHVSGPGTFRVQNSNVYAFPPAAMSSAATDLSSAAYGKGYYITTASTEFTPAGSGYPYSWYAFDQSSSTYWVSVGAGYSTSSPYAYTGTVSTSVVSGSAYTGEWLQLQLPISIILSSYIITCNGIAAGPSTFYMLGSSNGYQWTLLNSQSAISWSTTGQSQTFNVSTTFSYNYYRIVVTNVAGNGGYVQLQSLVLNGTEESINVTQDGKAGIGVRAPAQALEVAGNAIFYGNISAGNLGMFRNRIINGDMRFAQRGTSVNGTAGAGRLYRAVDRYYDWNSYTTYNVTFSQQTDAPVGFQFSHKILCTGAMTGGSFLISGQAVEGYNIADLMWGTSYAQPAILSFWIKQNKTGTFSVTFENETEQYIYLSTYTIYNAGAWEYKTISIPPPTTGTWNNTNGTGLYIHLIAQTPSVYSSVAFSPNWRTRTDLGGAWAAQITGTSTAIQSTNDYVMYTGLQLEKGTIATPFEFRPYGMELQLCQRYCEKIVRGVWGFNNSSTSGTNYATYPFKVTKRDTPVASGGATYSSYYQLHPDFAIVQRDNSTPDIQNVFFTAEL